MIAAESSQKKIERIVVLGGGSAGFLAALSFKRSFPEIKVSCVFSSKIFFAAWTPGEPFLFHNLGENLISLS